MSVALIATGFCCLSGCANRKPEVDFVPLQVNWTPAPGLDEDSVPTKDLCVIRITSRLMTEEPVRASKVGDLSYNVVFEQSLDNAENLVFTGVCEDLTRVDQPECKWFATCDGEGNVVVKFNNGD